MNMNQINRVYFIGIGGIGMSALARYFNSLGKQVAGYDKVKKPLTEKLEKENIHVHYKDDVSMVPKKYKENKQDTLIVYTPAIPEKHTELNYFKDNSFLLYKRSEVLGLISKDKHCIAVSGTHGKTSVSSIMSHVFNEYEGVNAFLGGIAKNYQSNLLLSSTSENVIMEADEFDKSFLQLDPYTLIITSIDEDHLDVYKNKSSLLKAFEELINKLPANGILLIKKELKNKLRIPSNLSVYEYSLDNEDADFFAKGITTVKGRYFFSLVTPAKTISNIEMGIPGLVNIKNAVAASAIAFLYGVPSEIIQKALAGFKGIERRFDIQYQSEKRVYIDDYAHLPQEIDYTIRSVKAFYPGRKITGVFQPHLFSRTKYFYREFANALEQLDEILLLDIYPAREEPIEGVTSDLIFQAINNANKNKVKKESLTELVKEKEPEILITMGAGDIDQITDELKETIAKIDSKA